MKKNKIQLCLMIMLSSYFSVFSQEKNEENKFEQFIQEFPFSQSVYLQEFKEFQQTVHGSHLENDEEIANILGYEAEFGLTDWFQISAGYAYEHHNIQNNPFDTGWLETGIVVGLFNNSNNAAALSFEGEFPVKKADIESVETEDSPSYTPTLKYAIQFYNTQLHLNAGAEFQEEEVNWFYNAAAVYGDGNFHPLIELNAVSEEDFKWYVGAGLVVNGESGWEAGAGLRHGINNSEWNALFNLIYEFNVSGEADD